MKELKKLLVSFLLIFFIPTQVLADGILIPPPDQNITTAQQKAVIVHQKGREDLIISLEFYGDAKEFAWLIPVPTKPEVKKGKGEIFTKLGQLSKPKKNLLERIKGERREVYFPTGKAIPEVIPTERGVEVIETKRVGILDISVLTATKAADLEKWLKENGYQVPGISGLPWLEKTQSTETTTPLGETESTPPRRESKPTGEVGINRALQIFQEYLDEGWYFVAAKIAQEFLEEFPRVTPSPEIPLSQEKMMIYPKPLPPDYRFGQAHITPLHLTFSTNKIVYPMKVSSLSYSPPSVLLYIIADHKKKVSNYFYQYPNTAEEDAENLIFKTEYAAPTKPHELSEWLPNLTGGYLTKLYAPSLDPQTMEEDLRFENARDDKTVRAGQMRGRDWLLVLPYLASYGPIRIVEWIGQRPFGIGAMAAWFFLAALGSAFSLVWVSIFYLLLSKARRKTLRIIFYLFQFPGVWLLANVFSAILVIPSWLIMNSLGVREDVVLSNLLIKNNLGVSLFTAIFYIFQSKIHLLFKGKEVGRKP